ncbi:hypothetical protein [Paenibacillus nanensis]|nr:hypothetical protein [Paenibacillus nanensis]
MCAVTVKNAVTEAKEAGVYAVTAKKAVTAPSRWRYNMAHGSK